MNIDFKSIDLMSMDLPNLAKTFYEAITFDSFIKFVIIYFFIIWIALLLWVMKDISNRTDSILLQVLSIFIILFLTPFGIFIYLLIRPGQTLFEKYYDEIEYNLETFNQLMEEKNKENEEGAEITCSKCDERIYNDFKFCPKCKIVLKNECISCGKLLNTDWKLCPYCGLKQKRVEKEKFKNKEKIKNIINEKEEVSEEEK